MEFDEMKMKIQKGDVITSKKGFISKSPISDEWYLYHKARYEGKGCLIVIGDKEKVNVTTHKRQ